MQSSSRSDPTAAGWSKLPVRLAVEERGRVAQAKEERWTAQKHALCKQIVSLQTRCAAAEAQREALQAERDTLLCRQEELTALVKERSEAVRQLGELNSDLKDQLLATQAKLEGVSEWRLERERGVKGEERLRGALAEREHECDVLRRQCNEQQHRLAQELEGHAETRRLLQCQLTYAEDLCRSNKALKKQRVQLDDTARVAAARCERAEKEQAELKHEVCGRDKRLEAAEAEAKRLRKDRAEARRALSDAEDVARERELLIREMTAENRSLAELIAAARAAAAEQQQDAAEVAVSANPVSVVTAGRRRPDPVPAQPSPLLGNLREHNTLLLSLLSNMLKQQAAQQKDLERQLEVRAARSAAVRMP
eukprot:TRINITY_DN3190_c0_g1_i1.p1 TRINITY_DN3190_c0_g1~~TRINITY_DN3190_c0_g1_i1.p1  ORF type:complete len:366 (+),score=168.44 TRINITY_DN3190_c0_g1_i1:49-1146(+)